jgi:hypothetical protein
VLKRHFDPVFMLGNGSSRVRDASHWEARRHVRIKGYKCVSGLVDLVRGDRRDQAQRRGDGR